MDERFDVIVVGAGPGGEVVVYRLVDHGLRIALVERELIGGECGYWACVPSKTLLRPLEIRREEERVAGGRPSEIDWGQVAAYRDYMVRDYNDAKQVEEYDEMGVVVVHGDARLDGPGAVRVDGRRLEAGHVVVATGSRTHVPDIAGLEETGYWTNRQATALKDVPESVAIVGGGPVGIELAQMFSGYGSHVTVVQRAERLLEREDAEVGELLRKALVDDGVEVRVHREVVAAHPGREGGKVLELDDGRRVEAQEIVIASGRRPNVDTLGLDSVGLQDAKALAIDDEGRVSGAPAGLWAVGDVTGAALFTHVAKYQGRAVAANILADLRGGRESRKLDYSAIPRVVFSSPEVAAVGITEDAARRSGLQTRGATVEMSSLTRPYTYEKEPSGSLHLICDEDSGTILGAWAVGPLASEWIHVASLAVQAGLTAAFLRDSMYQFPTFAEAYLNAAEQLAP